jgi:hypothetical protein
VVGDSVLGSVPESIAASCRQLAKKTQAVLLEVLFVASDKGNEPWLFQNANPFPQILTSGALEATARMLLHLAEAGRP